MSDSAITFARLTSTENQKEIDPSYYEHLDRILKKYFVYFVILTILIIILSWVTLHFSNLLNLVDSEQVTESLELSSIYGIILSLLIMSILILFIGLFLRHEQGFKVLWKRLVTFITGSKPQSGSNQPIYSSPSHHSPSTEQPISSEEYYEMDTPMEHKRGY